MSSDGAEVTMCGPAAGQEATATRQLQRLAQAYNRVIKLARTIADLAGEERIGAHHVAEALQYRPRERTV